MHIMGIDPGTTHSAYVRLDNNVILDHSKEENEKLIYETMPLIVIPNMFFVIEEIESFGMPVGRETFKTCVWSGRFFQKFCEIGKWENAHWVSRRDIKIHFCNSMRAKDGNVRQALIDRLGAPGTKKNPGRTYGIKADEWSALALAMWFQEAIKKEAK
jgi:hypothetical protein